MASIKKPVRATKGAPPAEVESSLNLTRSEDFELVPLNFKVAADFKREFKTFAAQRDISMLELLIRSFEEYKASKK